MTNKITLLFPGQGSQYIGMGKALSTELFSKADQALGYKLSSMCFEGPEDELKLTANTQPAILTHSMALFEQLQSWLPELDLEIERVLGHSVGEYSALTATGAFKFEDAVKAVHARGNFMQSAVPVGKGKMMAILKLPAETVKNACLEVSNEDSQVMAANYNEPSQTVVSGHAEACDRLKSWLSENIEERFRVVELPVSAPFHSSLMQPAADNMREELKNIEFQNLQYPYVANINAQEYSLDVSEDTIKNNLVDQVCGSVLWTQSIQQLQDSTLCLEVGPGKVLTGLVRKINPSITCLPLDQEDAFDKLKELLK